ncbi:MAG: serine--tRNA ligase [Candidatus Nealsonbacteria bacterium]
MLDLKFIRQNPEKVKEGLAKKQADVNIDELLILDEKKRAIQQKIESLRFEQGKFGKDDIAKAQVIKAEIKTMEPALADIDKALDILLRKIPNLPQDDVPFGKDDSENVVMREEGKKPKFDFPIKDYVEIGQNLDIIDTERASKVAGTRFGYLKGGAAMLEFALINLVMDTLTKEGFIPVVPPVMLKPEMMESMGYVERGADEIYYLEKDKLYLVGTSEQSIGAMHANETFEEKDLPKRYAGFSTCFRREAGAYGKDTKGILRVHQFDKIEMFSFCHPEKSKEEHQFLLKMEERLMQALELPYHVLRICSGDLGDPAAAKYDIEAWLPGQNQYRETHSTSNCTDFQARRLNVKYRDSKTKKPEFVHTLNGTAFAIGRTLIAIIENYQQKDGSILVPKALQKYVGFKKII